VIHLPHLSDFSRALRWARTSSRIRCLELAHCSANDNFRSGLHFFLLLLMCSLPGIRWTWRTGSKQNPRR
jgi:hypothetical protein